MSKTCEHSSPWSTALTIFVAKVATTQDQFIDAIFLDTGDATARDLPNKDANCLFQFLRTLDHLRSFAIGTLGLCSGCSLVLSPHHDALEGQERRISFCLSCTYLILLVSSLVVWPLKVRPPGDLCFDSTSQKLRCRCLPSLKPVNIGELLTPSEVDYCGGWVCFVCSLAMIGGVTALIGRKLSFSSMGSEGLF